MKFEIVFSVNDVHQYKRNQFKLYQYTQSDERALCIDTDHRHSVLFFLVKNKRLIRSAAYWYDIDINFFLIVLFFCCVHNDIFVRTKTRGFTTVRIVRIPCQYHFITKRFVFWHCVIFNSNKVNYFPTFFENLCFPSRKKSVRVCEDGRNHGNG